MPPQTMSPAAIAEALSVNSHTVRRWCAAHAKHLSPDANPAPNVARRLTGRDLEVLRVVAELRAQGLQASQINDRLAAMTFVEVEETPLQDDETGPNFNETTALVPASQVAALRAVYDAERQRWADEQAALHGRIEELQRELGRLEGQQRKRPGWWARLFGE